MVIIIAGREDICATIFLRGGKALWKSERG